jgi:hypothetical protein
LGFHPAGKTQGRYAFKRVQADSVTHADSTMRLYTILFLSLLSDGKIKNFRADDFFFEKKRRQRAFGAGMRLVFLRESG